MLPTKTREVTLEGNGRDARFPGPFVQRSAFAKSFSLAIGGKMTPDSPHDSPAPHHPGSVSERFIPRLGAEALFSARHRADTAAVDFQFPKYDNFAQMARLLDAHGVQTRCNSGEDTRNAARAIGVPPLC